MDEMTQVRTLRADAPRPDRSRLAAGRRELMNAAERRGPARRLRADWRLATAAAVVAITVTALLGGQFMGSGPQVQSPAGPAYTLELGSARTILQDAADVVAGHSAPLPHDGQWIYRTQAEVNATDQERPGLQEREWWTRYDDPASEGGKQGDDHSPRERFRLLDDLPDDLGSVKKKARAFYPNDAGSETRAQHDVRALTLLAQSYPAPAQGLATIYRALATVPGLKAAQTTDVLGRDAIAVYLPTSGAGGLRELFLIDAQTCVYSGSRTIAQKDDQDPDVGPEDRWKKGDVLFDSARKEIALVDKEGDRP